MACIHVKDRAGQVHRIETEAGRSVMEIIRDAGLPIEGQCGGCQSCATCHVYVDATWLPRLEPQSNTEVDMLELTTEQRDSSRLSCQIRFDDGLDGLTVELAPD